MKLNLEVEHFIELQKKSYSLDQIFLLKLIQEKKDLTSICNDSVKINTLYNSLIRKGLINEDNCLTLLGEEILSFIDSKGENIKLNNKVVNINDFDLWWEIFPANNKFDIFKATRTFKVKKDDCKTLFNKYINEKKYTAKEIIDATKYDIEIRKENSIKKRENQLTFLQNSHTYLYQESFQGFIGLELEENKKQDYDGINV